MTGPAYTDRLIKLLTGSGVRTDELQGRGEDFVDSLRDSARGEAINTMNFTTGGVSPVYYQEVYFNSAQIDQFEQDDGCVIKVPCPKPLYDLNGLPYVNWIGGSSWSCGDSFRIAKFRSELRGANTHYILGREGLTRAYYDTNQNCWWIYNNKSVEDFGISQIFAQPYKANTFNVTEDDYPFPQDQDNRLNEIVLRLYSRNLQAPADEIPNSRNDTQMLPVRPANR